MVRLETQRVRGHHAAVLHHGCRDGPHVLEELPGLAGAQRLDVSHDPVIGLRSEEKIKLSSNVLGFTCYVSKEFIKGFCQ